MSGKPRNAAMRAIEGARSAADGLAFSSPLGRLGELWLPPELQAARFGAGASFARARADQLAFKFAGAKLGHNLASSRPPLSRAPLAARLRGAAIIHLPH